MKIRLLIDAKMFGGVETHVMNLYEALVARDIDCKIIFVCVYPSNPLHTICNSRGISYQALRTYRELLQLLKTEKPDIIHTHGYKANILGRIIGLISPAKVVATFHAGEKPVGRLKLYNFLDRWTSFFSHNISVNSIIAANLPSHSSVIPNFVPIPSTSNPIKKSGPYNVYFVGRISPEKGPLAFCRMSTIPSDNIKWNMVGVGPLLATCKKEFGSSINFHGAVYNMGTVWPDIDLLCITSLYEGLPLIVLEAMSRGIPVISFDVGSVKEVLTDVEYIISLGDLGQMISCIESHFDKTIEARKIMSERSRTKIITTYSSKVVVPQLLSFYQECLLCK
jgi:glycosyltransferase involved in cell wall biosynthesis